MASLLPRPARPGPPYALSICARDEADACKSGSSCKAGDGSAGCLAREWLAAGPGRWLTDELPHGTLGLEYPRSNRELAESYESPSRFAATGAEASASPKAFQGGKPTGVSGHTSSILRSSADLKPYSPLGGIKASFTAKAPQPGGASIGASSLDLSQRLFQTFVSARRQSFGATLASLLSES